jgi:hypothetical protein
VKRWALQARQTIADDGVEMQEKELPNASLVAKAEYHHWCL